LKVKPEENPVIKVTKIPDATTSMRNVNPFGDFKEEVEQWGDRKVVTKLTETKAVPVERKNKVILKNLKIFSSTHLIRFPHGASIL